MAANKKSNHSGESFWKIASENYHKVQSWPQWKRSIKITSATASTGNFIIIQRSKDSHATNSK